MSLDDGDIIDIYHENLIIEKICNNSDNIICNLLNKDNIEEKILKLDLKLSNSDNESYEYLLEYFKSLKNNKKYQGPNYLNFKHWLFFSLKCPFFKINHIQFKIGKSNLKFKISYMCDPRYLFHELINPFNNMNNCIQLLDYQIKNLSICETEKENLYYYQKILDGQINNCLLLSKLFLKSNDDISFNNNFSLKTTSNNNFEDNNFEYINLFDYIKNYCVYYKNLYQYPINIDNIELNNLCKKPIYLDINHNIIYLRIILDNIIKNAIQNNNVRNLVSIKLTYPHVMDKFYEFKIINNIKLDNNNKLYNYDNKYMSNFIGMELIDKLSNKLNIKWTLLQEDDNIIFSLKIPIIYKSNNIDLLFSKSNYCSNKKNYQTIFI